MVWDSSKSVFGEPGLSTKQKTKNKQARRTLLMTLVLALSFCLVVPAEWAFAGGGGGGAGGAAATPDLLMPSPPRNVSASPGNGMATVSFESPKTDGGSSVTGYTVISYPGRITARGKKSPIEIKGLSNGMEYVFTVSASNSVGTGLASEPSNKVTPGAQ
jgi:hypothetical protein